MLIYFNVEELDPEIRQIFEEEFYKQIKPKDSKYYINKINDELKQYNINFQIKQKDNNIQIKITNNTINTNIITKLDKIFNKNAELNRNDSELILTYSNIF